MNQDVIAARAASIRTRIEVAAARSGRDAGGVAILPITKGHPAETIRTVAAAGFDRIGENRVQEAREKWTVLQDLDLAWHMVGHVQRNKVARVTRLFDVVESVDSVRLAVRLSDECERQGRKPLPVLVQVNASGEGTKGGFAVADALEPVRRICDLQGLRVIGLMTMAPFVPDRELLRSVFRRTRELFERCAADVPAFRAEVLSMGMSNDFEIAVEEGSTELRLGTILTGERPGSQWT